MKKVITYSTSSGQTINVCKACEKKLGGSWPINDKGEEFSTVNHGLHNGHCDYCGES